MKRVLSSVVTILVSLLPTLATGQQVVHLDHIDGAFSDCTSPILIDGAYIQFDIRLTNLNGLACAYEPSVSFTISSPDGAEWSSLSLDTASGGAVWFDQVDYWQGALTGLVADTVALSLLAGSNTGLTDGTDEAIILLGFQLDASSGATICLDTASGGFDWSWAGLGSCGDILPDWEGPYCYAIGTPADMPPIFFAPPAVISGEHCEPMAHDFEAVDPDPGAGPGPDFITYTLVQGIGTIDALTGVWTWDGVSGMIDASDTILIVAISEADNCNGGPLAITDTVTLSISNDNNQAPYFTSGCRALVMAARNVETSLTLTGYDNCPLDEVSAKLIQTDAIGNVAIEGTTVKFTPDPADNDTITVRVVATDGIDTADEWCEVYFSILDCDGCSCCGLYTGGFTGNLNMDVEGKRTLADLTKMIDHVYVSKSPLLCPANANMDGDSEGRVNLADITRFVDLIYISKEQSAPCQ